MRNLWMIAALPVAMLLASCDKGETGSTIPEADDEVYYLPVPTVVATQTDTRTIVNNDPYFPFTAYRMWMESADATINQWYQGELGYDYINAALSGSWRYTPRGASSYTNAIGMFKSKGEVTVYAVHPANLSFDLADFQEIPFTIGLTDATNFDYMYAVPQSVDPAIAADLSKVLPFRHIMTLMEFRLSTAYVGTLQVKSITVKAVDSSDSPVAVFGMEGTFSALDGTVVVEPSSHIDKIVMDYGDNTVAWKKATSGLGYTSFGIIVPQIPYQAGTDDIHLEIVIDFFYPDEDDDQLTGKGSTLVFDLAEVLTNSTAQGFLSGYRYVFNIEIDNFIKYLGYPVAQPWLLEKDTDGNDVTHEIKF